MKKFVVLLISALILFSFYSFASDAPDYLIKGTSARVSAMGDTFTAIADDANSVYWNPAGLSITSIPQFLSTHSSLNDFDMNTENISLVYPLKNCALGFNIVYSNIGSIPKTSTSTVTGRAEMLGLFNESEVGYLLSYGQKVNDKLSMGASLKGIQVKFDEYKENGIGLDIGFLYNFSKEITAGINFQNIGGIDLGVDEVPTNAKIGLAYKSPKDNFILGADVDTDIIGESVYHVGAEYLVVKGLLARVGTNDGDLTFGVGMKFGNWQFDYAYNDLDVGDIHKVSVLLDFEGKKVAKKEAKEEVKKQVAPVERKPVEKAVEPTPKVKEKIVEKTIEETKTLPPTTPTIKPQRETAKEGKIINTKTTLKGGKEVSIHLGEESGIKRGNVITILMKGKEVAEVKITIVGYAISYGEIINNFVSLDEFELFLGDQVILP